MTRLTTASGPYRSALDPDRLPSLIRTALEEGNVARVASLLRSYAEVRGVKLQVAVGAALSDLTQFGGVLDTPENRQVIKDAGHS